MDKLIQIMDFNRQRIAIDPDKVVAVIEYDKKSCCVDLGDHCWHRLDVSYDGLLKLLGGNAP